MKFCIITPTVGRNDGQGRVNLEIAAEAERQGHDVTLIAESINNVTAQLRQNAILLPPPSWLRGRLLRDQLFALRTYRILCRRHVAFDAILANGFVTWARSDLNAVHFVHASWLRSAYHPWRVARNARSLYAWLYNVLNVALEQHAFRLAKRLVAVSHSVAADLRRDGVPVNRIAVILNGVDVAEFHPGLERRDSLGLPETAKIALFAGDLKSPRKNLETVLSALARVPGLHLAVAGRQTGTPYPQLAETLGVADRVHFLGFRHDMARLMRAVDMFVFPSRYEPCGLVLLEALASGLPVVTARSAGGSEIIRSDVGSVLDDCDDVDNLVAHLNEFLTDEQRMASMSHEARLLAKQHCWPLMAGHYVDMLVTAARSGPEQRTDEAAVSTASLDVKRASWTMQEVPPMRII